MKKTIMMVAAVLIMTMPVHAKEISVSGVCMTVTSKAQLAMEAYVDGDVPLAVALYAQCNEIETPVVLAIFGDKFGDRNDLRSSAYRELILKSISDVCQERLTEAIDKKGLDT